MQPEPLTEAHAKLDRLWARGAAFLGCPYAILGGAMSWVSEKNLVSAISNAGGFGIIACGAMSPAQLAEQIAQNGRIQLEGRSNFNLDSQQHHPVR